MELTNAEVPTFQIGDNLLRTPPGAWDGSNLLEAQYVERHRQKLKMEKAHSEELKNAETPNL